jgi:uncharacterized repeat protein (TIGR01451 family)
MKRILNINTACGLALMVAAAAGSALTISSGAYGATRSTSAKPKAKPAAKPAAKPSAVTLSSEAMVERTIVGADGKESITLKSPKDVVVVPGDRIIFTLKYQNQGVEPATGFRATNPMPAPVQFVGVTEDWAEVSVDGGATWGRLVNLKVKTVPSVGGADIMRTATAQDVTHVRWIFATPIAAGAKGSVSYRGVIK